MKKLFFILFFLSFSTIHSQEMYPLAVSGMKTVDDSLTKIREDVDLISGAVEIQGDTIAKHREDLDLLKGRADASDDTSAAHLAWLSSLKDTTDTQVLRADSIDARTATIDSMTINYILHIVNMTASDSALAIYTGIGTDTTFIDPAAGYALRHSDNGVTKASIDTNGTIFGTNYTSDGSITDAELKDIDNFTGTGDYVKAGSPTLTGTPELAAPTATKNAVGTAQTIGLTLQNTTAAAAGAQQYSPMYVMKGFGWKTDATAGSQAVEFGWQVVPVQGATAPTGQYNLYSRIAGGAWSSTPIITALSSGWVGVGIAPSVWFHSLGGIRTSTEQGFEIGASTGVNRLRTFSTGTTIRFLDSANNYASMGLGSFSIGAAYGGLSAPASGLIVQGSTYIGTSSANGSTAKLLTWGGNIASWNPTTLGSATLTNPNLTSGTSWTATNDAALTGDECRWIYSAGTASTLTQTSATFAIPVQPNRIYVFTYVVSDVAGTPSASITTAIASETTALTLTNGAQTTYFMSGSSPGNFVITATLTAGQRFDLDTFVLKEAQGGNMVAGGKFTGGGTAGLKVDGSGNTFIPQKQNFFTDVSANDDYQFTTTEITAYTDGLEITFNAVTTNTGACTLQINALGAVAIKTAGNDDPPDNYIDAAGRVKVIYCDEATDYWQLQTPDANP